MLALAAVRRRALARVPPRVRDWIFTAIVRGLTISAARGVSPAARFAFHELFLVRRVHGYRLRRSGRTLFVRHPVYDAWVVHEVLGSRVYQPPPPVRRALADVRSPRIVDLGAHIGAATLLLLESFPGARILAVEPQPETARLLRRMIAANGLDGQCEVLEAAAGVATGTATMEGFSLLAHFVRSDTEEAVDLLPPLRKYAVNGGVTRVEVADALPLLQGADVVKMDIEGAEWPILQDPRFPGAGISALVLEYHPQAAPQSDTLAAVRGILGDAGFAVGDPVEQSGSVGVVWAWRE